LKKASVSLTTKLLDKIWKNYYSYYYR
jgi:hypothetical protein